MFIKNWHDTRLYANFQRQIDLKRSQQDTSSTKASSANTSYVHQKLTWDMFICYFSKTNRDGPSVLKGDQDALRHLQRPHQAQPWYLLYSPWLSFTRSLRESESILIPLETRQPGRVPQVGTSYLKKNTWHMFYIKFFKRNQWKWSQFVRGFQVMLINVDNVNQAKSCKLVHGTFKTQLKI